MSPAVRPFLLSAAATLAIVGVSACGGDASDAGVATAPPPFTLASDVPFCQPVVEAVRANYETADMARPVPDDPRYGGTVVVAGGGDLQGGLNGLTTRDQQTQETELHLVHATLISFDADRNPQPYLAASWTIDDDRGGATIRIRDDMVWHDGRPVTVEDVAFTFRTAMDPAVAFPNAAWFASYDPEGIEIVDDTTLRFTFEPHAGVEEPWAGLSIMPVHWLGDVPADSLANHPFGTECPVGAGPYVFEAYRPGDQWVLRANPAFPDELGGRPFIDRYVYRVITASSTRAAELMTGAVDVALGMEPVDAPAVESAEGVRVEAYDQRGFAFVAWNTRLPGLDDARVRRAMTMALDRPAMVQTLRAGYGVVAETGVGAFHWAHDPTLQGPDHDVAGARALLDEAGWTDRDGDGVRENAEGVALRIEVITNANTEREGIGRILRDQLAEVGVAIDLAVLEVGTLQERAFTPGAREFGGIILGWAHDFNINERSFFHSDSDADPYGFSALSDPELDRLLDSLPTTFDREEAGPLWQRYQERIVELQPFTYLYFSQRMSGVRSSLGGVELDVRGELMSAPRWYWEPESP
ncbi:MAG: hypothetical protein KJP18_04175 [Gemmatimonadetes bacterium]|nr:hypothetical protein [Gemmatimonadota bacterium]